MLNTHPRWSTSSRLTMYENRHSMLMITVQDVPVFTSSVLNSCGVYRQKRCSVWRAVPDFPIQHFSVFCSVENPSATRLLITVNPESFLWEKKFVPSLAGVVFLHIDHVQNKRCFAHRFYNFFTAAAIKVLMTNHSMSFFFFFFQNRLEIRAQLP